MRHAALRVLFLLCLETKAMADDLQSQALPLQIKVLDGPLSQKNLQAGLPNGTVHLEGRSGAYRPITFEREMRRKTTFYPGNPEGTQQIIGKTYKPTSINGIWKDRFLGDGVARQFEDLFDTILDSGSSLEVSWGTGIADTGDATEGEAHVRIGILASFKTSPDRPQDIAWEMVFEWRGKGQAQAPVITATAEVNSREGFTAAVGDLQFSKEAFGAYVDGTLLPIPEVVLNAIDDAFTSIDSATDTILRANAVVAQSANFPVILAGDLSAAASLGIQALSDLRDSALKLDPSRLLNAVDDALQYLVLKDQILTLIGITGDSTDTLKTATDGIASQVLPEVIAEVVAPEGVDLRDLALRYYGDPDSWWAIANFNDIDGSEVPPMPSGPGDVPPDPIRIPRLQAGPQSDLRQNC
jgi:hypothetical protein